MIERIVTTTLVGTRKIIIVETKMTVSIVKDIPGVEIMINNLREGVKVRNVIGIEGIERDIRSALRMKKVDIVNAVEVGATKDFPKMISVTKNGTSTQRGSYTIVVVIHDQATKSHVSTKARVGVKDIDSPANFTLAPQYSMHFDFNRSSRKD